MSNKFTYSISKIRFDENYKPADSTRLTTFANLARGESRQNLRKLTMILVFFGTLGQSNADAILLR